MTAALVVLACAALIAAYRAICRRDDHRHRYPPVDLDPHWRAFDASMTRHTKERT